MGRAAEAKAQRGGAAARVAARRRPAGKGRDNARASAGRGKAGRSGGGFVSSIARAFKMLVLIAAFLAIGFFGVLVIDVGASVVGQLRFGETTVAGLWHKVADRFLDNDVPRAPEPAATPAPVKKAQAPRPSRATPSSTTAERAPARASRPEDDARHVESPSRADPTVEHARRRLDEILGRL